MSRFPFRMPDFSLSDAFGRVADKQKEAKPSAGLLREQQRSTKTKPKPETKRPAPVSVRLTVEEREELTRQAAGMSISAFIRERLFGDGVAPRKTRGKFPVDDHRALARVLAALGRSDTTAALKRVSQQIQNGRASVRPETERQLLKACADIEAMKADLITALGLKSERRA